MPHPKKVETEPRPWSHRSTAKGAITALSTLLLSLSIPAANSAEWWEPGSAKRAGKWETNIGLYISGSESEDGLNNSSIDVDTGYGFGFGIGYNFSDHLALRFDGSWVRPDYDAILDTEDEGLVEISHRLSMFNGQFNGVWNILDGPFTPYLQAGVGWTYIDSNVADGPPSTGCWWDPWWGYICAPFYSTYSDTNFSWNVGAGLRYELGRGMFVRGAWERTHIDGGSGVDPEFDAYRFELGWMF